MLISIRWATAQTIASDDGIASPATSSGIPAATSEAKTRIRMIAAIGSETASARWRSASDCFAESRVIGP